MDVDKNQLIAICDNLFQVVEIWKFFTDLEEVASVIYDKDTFWGSQITEEEKERWQKNKF